MKGAMVCQASTKMIDIHEMVTTTQPKTTTATETTKPTKAPRKATMEATIIKNLSFNVYYKIHYSESKSKKKMLVGKDFFLILPVYKRVKILDRMLKFKIH